MHFHCSVLRPVPTQENKHRIGSDRTFFHLVLSAPPDTKKLKILALQFFIIRVADHRLKLKQKIGTESPMRGFNFVPIRSDSMLMFLSGNPPLVRFLENETLYSSSVYLQVLGDVPASPSFSSTSKRGKGTLKMKNGKNKIRGRRYEEKLSKHI